MKWIPFVLILCLLYNLLEAKPHSGSSASQKVRIRFEKPVHVNVSQISDTSQVNWIPMDSSLRVTISRADQGESVSLTILSSQNSTCNEFLHVTEDSNTLLKTQDHEPGCCGWAIQERTDNSPLTLILTVSDI